MIANGSKMDPTRTTGIRRQFEAALKLRYRALKAMIIDLVYGKDALGLGDSPTPGLRFNALTPDMRKLLHESSIKGGEGATKKHVDKSAAQKLLSVLFPADGKVTLAELVEQYHKLGRRNYPDEVTHEAVNDAWLKAASAFPREELERLIRSGQLEFEPTRTGQIQGGTFPAYLEEATPGVTQLLRTKLGARSSEEPAPPPTPVAAPVVPPPAPPPVPVAIPLPPLPVMTPMTPATEEEDAPEPTPGLSNPNKVKRFRAWLRIKMDSTLAGDELIQQYIDQGYRRGTERAFDDLRRGGAMTGEGEQADLKRQGAKEEFSRIAMTKSATVEKVKLLAGRTFHELEDVNTKMSARMSRVLVDALVQGWSPAKAAREMTKQVDLDISRASAIVRTELVRAHSEGQLDALEMLGETEVGVAAEWITAHDGKVCPKCKALEGRVFGISDARGMLPLHPRCRCAWVPLRKRRGKVR